jgi:hypothetical protein
VQAPGRSTAAVAHHATLDCMRYPTSIRLSQPVKDRLDRAAAKSHESHSAIAVRLIDEGLRMAEHPGITFHDSPVHGRVACLVGGPDVAEVVDVLTGLEATGEQRVEETARWFGIDPSQVRIAMGYYAAFRDEIDRQIDVRRREASELRRRYEVEQALLE